MKKWLDRYDKGGPTGKKLSQAEIANIRNFVANNADVNDINDPRYYMGRPPVNKSYNVTNRLSASNLPRYVDPNVKNDPSLKWVNAAAMLGPLGILAAPEIAAATATAAPYLTAPAVVAGTELAGVTPASIAAAYFAHEGYKKLPQTQASVVNAYRNPTTRNIINAANDVGWNTMDFLGLGEASKLAGEIANPISKLPGYYNKVATGESALPFAWKSPAVGLSQESSQAMFDKLLNSGQFTNEELKLIRQYQNNSSPFTGRHTPINLQAKKQLNDIIKKYNLTGIDNAIATRRFNPDNNSIGATIENNTINFGDRPTSFSAGIGLPDYGSGATNRIVIPNRYLSGMGDRFIANSYPELSIMSNERELIGTGLNFKRIGKVKNDIGGHDWIVKPINSTSEKELEWVKPSEQQLKQEFNIEHQLKNLNLFNNEDEFMNAVNNAKVEEVTTFDDKFIKNRSRANTKDQIIDYSKTYRSWPKYRNEQTIDNIYNGINSNGKMDMPIILEYPDGSRKMLSGNTRMDVSFQLGKNPKALIVKVPEQTTSLPQIQTVPREELPKYLYHGGPNIITDVNSIKRTREGLPIGNSATDENSVGFYAGPYTWFPREGVPNAFRETEGLYNRINMMGENAEYYAAGHPHGYIHEGELNPEANIVDWNTFTKLIQSDKFDFRRLSPKGAEIAENLGIHAIRDNSEYNILNPQKVFKSFKPAYKKKFGESWERFAKGGENINMGWLDKYADGGQKPARDNTTVYRNTLPIAGPKLPARTYISATPGYKDSEWYKQESEDYKTRRNITQPILHAADVTTDAMQLGNFIPFPLTQEIGKLGNFLGPIIDSYQAADAFANNDYVNGSINAASAFLPSVINNPKVLGGYRRSAKYNFGNRSFYNPVDKRYGRMTKKQLLANRILLGTLGAETGYDSYAEGGNTTDYNFSAWQLADPIRASYHVVNPEKFHGPDTYKYPNHMTFSDESMYSTPEHMGGHWTELKNGKWQFEPSQWNIQNAGGKKEFLKWWKETEGKEGNKIKLKGGGQIHNWREVKVPHKKNQLSGWLDKL